MVVGGDSALGPGCLGVGCYCVVYWVLAAPLTSLAGLTHPRGTRLCPLPLRAWAAQSLPFHPCAAVVAPAARLNGQVNPRGIGGPVGSDPTLARWLAWPLPVACWRRTIRRSAASPRAPPPLAATPARRGQPAGGGQQPLSRPPQQAMPNRFTKPGGGSGGGGGSAAKGEASYSARNDAGTRSYSEAARGRDWEAELSDLRKANAKLLRQVATLQSGQAAGEDDDMDDDDGDEAARDERIRTLEAGIPVLVGIYSEDAVQVKEARDELQALVRQRRESKPLRTQLQNIDRRIDKQRLRSEKLQSKSDEIWEQISALRNEHSTVAEELEETKEGLAKLEDERKALLLKEAQAAEAAATVRPSAPPEDAAWDTVMQAIGARINIPGANQHLATQVAATVQMLKDLLVQCAPPAGGGVATAQVQQPVAPPPPQPQQAAG